MITQQSHILVVDDSMDAADSTAELLTMWGYDVQACYSGVTALHSALICRPWVVLLDVAMPRMDGFRFAELFRDLPKCATVPIIAVTGYSGEEYYARAKKGGIQHYLLKPTKPDDLRELLTSESAKVIPIPIAALRRSWWRFRQVADGPLVASNCGSLAKHICAIGCSSS